MLTKRKNGGVWWVRFRIGRREIFRSTGTEDRAQAEEFEQRTRARAWRALKLGDKFGTWDEAVALFRRDKKPKRKPYNWQREEAILKWFTDTGLRGVSLLEVNAEVIDAIRQRLRREKRSPGTADRFLSELRAVLRYAHRKGLAQSVPEIELFRESPPREDFLSREQFATLFRELPPHLKAPALFAVHTGFREDNVIGLTWDRVDMERGVVYLPGSHTKSGKAHGMPLNDTALDLLRYIAREGRHVFTFEGQPLTRFSNHAFYKARKRAGVPWCRWHDLRHTFASWLAMGGATALDLKAAGGWSSLRMVERYGHLSPGHLRDVVRLIG